MNITMSLEDYEALVTFARSDAPSAEKRRSIEAFLRTIEKANGINRYFLWVQWQELGYALPATAVFPEVWPPELRASLERTDRAIARADVDAVLASRATRPTTILVTTDPGAELGWTAIDDFFVG